MGGVRRRSHSSHFLTEGDKNISAECKTMDVRLVRGGPEVAAAVVCAERRDGSGTCRRETTGGLAARPGGVSGASARVHITSTLVTPQANTQRLFF